MAIERKSLWTFIMLLALAACSVLLKFGIEYLQVHRSAENIKEVQQECASIESALNGFFKQNARLPKSLDDLKITNLPIEIKRFGYVNNTNWCVITFHDGTGYNLYQPCYFNGDKP